MSSISVALSSCVRTVSSSNVGKQRTLLCLMLVAAVVIVVSTVHLFSSSESTRSLHPSSPVRLISSSKYRLQQDFSQRALEWKKKEDNIKLLLRKGSTESDYNDGGDGVERLPSEVLDYPDDVGDNSEKESLNLQEKDIDDENLHWGQDIISNKMHPDVRLVQGQSDEEESNRDGEVISGDGGSKDEGKVIMEDDDTKQGIEKETADESSSLTKNSIGSCHPSNSVVMIKTHKCSSSTVQNILLRYAENNNLSVALPKSGVYFTTSAHFSREHIFMDDGHRKYNIMASHMKFHEDSRKVIQDVMTSDTKYITLLRNPAEQYESLYTYLGWKHRFQADLKTFLQDPEVYFVQEPPVALYAGRNPMCYDLGLDARRLEEGAPEVVSFIFKAASWFDLVLITEYLDESLILLKDLMCWSLQDVAYFSQNARHKDSVVQLTESEKEAAMRWNSADALLYRFFNVSLWQKIEAYGKKRMSEDLAQLRSIKADLGKDCIQSTLSHGDKRVYYPGGIKVNSFQLSPSAKHQRLCEQMTMPEIEYLKQMRAIQVKRFVKVDSGLQLEERLKLHSDSGERTKQSAPVKLEISSKEKVRLVNDSSPLSSKVFIPSQTAGQDSERAGNVSGRNGTSMVAVQSTVTCQPLDNVVMIKTHKCSSSTLQNILLRRAEDNNLKIALPKEGVYLGAGYLFDRRFIYMDHGTEKYNIMASHMKLKVAKFPAVRTVMASGTKYITILRNPADQYESMYTYYGWSGRFGVDLHTFLQNPEVHFRREPSSTLQAGRNPMCYDNGLDARYLKPGDASVGRFIATMDEWHDFVLIADYFDQSLILLKDLMCWSLSDIVSLKQNARSQESVKVLSPKDKELVMKWNWADTMLYQYFNTSLWKKIDTYGRERMEREVLEMKRRNKYIAEDCIGRTLHQGDQRVWYPQGIKVDSFQVNPNSKDPHLCSQLTRPELNYLGILREKQLQTRSRR